MSSGDSSRSFEGSPWASTSSRFIAPLESMELDDEQVRIVVGGDVHVVDVARCQDAADENSALHLSVERRGRADDGRARQGVEALEREVPHLLLRAAHHAGEA